MPNRRRISTLAGQGRRAGTLGGLDPRQHRGAQGLAGAEFYVGNGLTIDSRGRLAVDLQALGLKSGTTTTTTGASPTTPGQASEYWKRFFFIGV